MAKLKFQARSAKRGLWVEPDPVAPWEWRRQKRSGKSSRAQIFPTDTDAPYLGNTSSMVFHRQGCKYYDCKNCTVSFSSRQVAVGDGYKPCGICRP